MNLDDVVRATRGRLAGRAPSDWQLGTVTTDSRTVKPGDLFVALRGANLDGNEFVGQAVARGAAVIVCANGRGLSGEHTAVVEVDDTLVALGDLAHVHRMRFSPPLVAITGSNGKTSTKELLRAVLAVAYGIDRVLANEGNFNNLIGLPLTLFHLDACHRAAVVEMGMNAPGEIARLTEIAAPTVGVITCVGSAHLEGLGSIEGIARAKGELYAGLSPEATAVVNLEDARVVDLARAFAGRKIGFGSGGDVKAEAIEPLAIDRTRFVLVSGRERRDVEIPLAGRHNVSNALAAAAAATALEIPLETIAHGLGSALPPPMRLAAEPLANGVCLVNDAYNANPSSLEAAFDTVADLPAERIVFVLGEMLELGAEAAELHRKAGRSAAARRPALVCAMGTHAQALCEGAIEAGMAAGDVIVATSHQAAAETVAQRWRAGDLVLVKGSRGARMENVVTALRERAKP